MFGRTTHQDVTPHDANAPADGHVLLDVRELHEWAAGHAPHAVHLPLSELHPDRLPLASTLMVVCRSGGRSQRAVGALLKAGYQAVNVAGGMSAWEASGLPLVRSDGQPGTVI